MERIPVDRIPFVEGRFCGLDQDRYHLIEAISSSGLNNLSRSPAHYRNSVLFPPAKTAAMIVGAALHTAILESGEFAARYICEPLNPATGLGWDGRLNAGKEAMAQLVRDNPDKTILKYEDWQTIESVGTALISHADAWSLLSAGEAEVSYFWTDKELNVPCKCRPDKIYKKRIVDLKTTMDARYEHFRRSIRDYGYDVQSAMYMDGTGADEWFYIVVEKEPPHGIMIYEACEKFLEAGHAQYRKLLEQYAECKRTDVWPAYPPTRQLLLESVREQI